MNFNFSDTKMVVCEVYQNMAGSASRHQCSGVPHGDVRGNPTKTAGGAYGFVHYDKKVEIHGVIEVCEEEKNKWTHIGVNRNALRLTPMLCVIGWDEWVGLVGYHNSGRGTSRIWKVGPHRLMAAYLESKIGKYTYCVETREVFV